VEVVASYAIGLPAELAMAPSLTLLYPDILTIKGKPLLKIYGDVYFGWY